jgi:type 1 fimbria pilin
MLNITSISGDSVDNLSEAIDKAIESLKEDINSAKDDDTVAITVISEKGVLRSFELASVEDGKKHTASLTTTVKDGTYYVKGSLKEDEAALIDFSYQQKPNDKGSADGELNMTIDGTTKTDESDDTSGDTSETKSGIGNELLNLDKFTVNMKFSGQKTDNKVAIDGKLELSTNQSGLAVTIPINIAVKYEKVSDLENKYSVNLSFNIMGTEADLSISGGRSVIEYTAAQIPGDDAVNVAATISITPPY